MSYTQFLRSLLEEGRIVVPEPAELSDEQYRSGGECLRQLDGLRRMDWPSGAPAFDGEAAAWAGASFLRAAQAVVFRFLDLDFIREAIEPDFDGEKTSSVQSSVDLVFQFLPDLATFARSAAEQDPLLVLLRKWAVDWPLSSVGMKNISLDRSPEGEKAAAVDDALNYRHGALDALMSDPCLTTVYVDRIIDKRDETRIYDGRVRAAICAAFGAHTDLDADFSRRVREYQDQGAA